MKNPFDTVTEQLVGAMESIHADMKRVAADVNPYGQEKLTPAEESLMYDHPIARYPGQVDPTTGLPMTNAQAAQKMLDEMGPAAYTAWVDDVERRRNRRMVDNG